MKTPVKRQRVEAEVRRLVATLPVGAKLPPERELAVMYQCNFLTVRDALKALAGEGLIVRRLGSGTFVARKPEADSPGRPVVGMLICQESNAYALRLMRALAQAGREQGVDLRSAWVGDLAGEALAQAHQFQKEGVSALVLPWFPHEKGEEVRALARRCPLPLSLALLIPGLERNCYIRPELFPASTDGAVAALCRYYQLLGQRRIAFLGPESAKDAVLRQRLAAYIGFASAEKLPQLCGMVGPGARPMDELAESWSVYRGELAVISYDDEHALRFMTAMHKLGLAAPADYRIIGYNNTEGSAFSDPPLSTIAQDFEAIAHWLLQNALALCRNETSQASKPPRPRLLVRSTCGGRELIHTQPQTRLPGLGITLEAGAPTAS